ncbi:thiamine pyrophosphokinase [Pyrenophora tritici-repentis]|nr:thiamine pyrophosphokinase [Pyrenophora tritici-repentis]
MAQTSVLLTLPGEIRNQIVEYILDRELGTYPPPLRRSPLAIPWTCRQLYLEFQSLVRHSTVFTIQWSSANDLIAKASILPHVVASSITKLQIQLPSRLEGLYMNDSTRSRIKSFDFALAGLTSLEEVYFRYRPEHHDEGAGGRGRELVVLILWKMLWEKHMKSLRKICIVHDGTQPRLSMPLLYGMLESYQPLRMSRRWEVRSHLAHGQLLFVERCRGQVIRQVSVIVGYSFREAEQYITVCKEVLAEEYADMFLARRRDCKYVTPPSNMSDEEIRCELDSLRIEYPVLEIMANEVGSEYEPGKFLADAAHPETTSNPPDLLILNQPIAHFDAFSRLWKHSGHRICADGGANRLFDMFKGDLAEQRKHYLPNLIHGDLDSLRDDVRDYYEGRGVPVLRDGDQISTDFGKCMRKLSSRLPASALRDVLVLGTLGGRVDQGLGLLHEMAREESRHENLRLWLFSESSLSFILRSGTNFLSGLQQSGVFSENVGILPIYGPAIISTEGLEWDVREWETRIGGQVSTSNHVKADVVRIETNAQFVSNTTATINPVSGPPPLSPKYAQRASQANIATHSRYYWTFGTLPARPPKFLLGEYPAIRAAHIRTGAISASTQSFPGLTTSGLPDEHFTLHRHAPH